MRNVVRRRSNLIRIDAHDGRDPVKLRETRASEIRTRVFPFWHGKLSSWQTSPHRRHRVLTRARTWIGMLRLDTRMSRVSLRSWSRTVDENEAVWYATEDFWDRVMAE